jgi:hypothetical protein
MIRRESRQTVSSEEPRPFCGRIRKLEVAQGNSGSDPGRRAGGAAFSTNLRSGESGGSPQRARWHHRLYPIERHQPGTGL